MSWLERMRRHRYVAGLAADRLWLSPAPDAPAGGPGIPFASGSAGHALQALAGALVAVAGPAGAPGRPHRALDVVLDVVLDGSHVRWKLVDPPPRRALPGDRQAILAHQFGDPPRGPGDRADAAGAWDYRAAEQPAGWPAPAGAVDSGLLAGLEATCRAAGVRLGRVRPYFSAAFDHWRRSIPEDSYRFCVLDSGSVGLGLLHRGRWQGLAMRRPAGDWRTQVATLQAQLAIPAGIDADALPGYLVDARPDGGGDRPASPDAGGEPHAWPGAGAAAGDSGFRRLGPSRSVPSRLAHGL